MSASRPELILYGRTGCHLCEAMAEELQPYLEHHGLSLRQIDISGQAALEARYGWDIPVLAYGTEEVCRHFLDLKSFQTKLSECGLIP
ncbi:MAG: glutaredoxin family protein [Thiobacillaceae bacterium]